MSRFIPFLLVLVLFVFASKVVVNAQSLEITGNSDGSQNNITVQGSNTNSNTQDNSFKANNDIDAKADTGGNSANGNNSGNAVIKTGDSKVTVKVNNQGNTNVSDIDCCDGKPTKTPTKSPTSKPTATPTPSNGGNGGGNGGTGGGNGGGTTAGAAASNPQVIGLSKTSGENNIVYIFYLSGLVCLGLAGKLLLRN